MATGKRQIKTVPLDENFFGDESDDPDFEMSDSSDDGEKDGPRVSSSSDKSSSSSSSDSGGLSDLDVGDQNEHDNDKVKSKYSDGNSSDSNATPRSRISLEALKQKMREISPPFNNGMGSKGKKRKKPVNANGKGGKKSETKKAKSASSSNTPAVKTKTEKSRPRTTSPQSKTKSKTPKDKDISKKKKEKVSESPAKKKLNSSYGSISDLVADVRSTTLAIRSDLDWNEKICAACLGTHGSEDIMECDNCRITVHEGCYIYDDASSISSKTDSSSATEPWFCDACRYDVANPSCELCPNPGGLFKQTTDGRWVHTVCALYNAEIGSCGRSSLSLIPYGRFGCRQCQLCDNERSSSLGICIVCDAGFCKYACHATCAQRKGLLSSPTENSEEATPFFASCKHHSNKDTIKLRIKNYKKLQELIRIKRDQKSEPFLSETERRNLAEIQAKLLKSRERVQAKDRMNMSLARTNRNIRNPEAITTVAIPLRRKARLLHTSAFALNSFQLKTEVAGHDNDALEYEAKEERMVASVSKKWGVRPALNVEFAAYYADREKRITTYSQQSVQLKDANNQMNVRQKAMQKRMEGCALNHMESFESSQAIVADIQKLRAILEGLGGRNIHIQGVTDSRPSPPRALMARRSSPPKLSITAGKKKTFTASPPSARIFLHCAICKRNDAQHMITRCDNCNKHFHIGCLDPPLTRMPKKSRQCGWMCSDCGDLDLTPPEQKVDTEAPRELRGRTKIKRPAKYTELEGSDVELEEGGEGHGQPSVTRERRSGSRAATPMELPKIKQPRVTMEPLLLSIKNVNNTVAVPNNTNSNLTPNEKQARKFTPRGKDRKPRKRRSLKKKGGESKAAKAKKQSGEGGGGGNEISIPMVDLSSDDGLTPAEKSMVDARSSSGSSLVAISVPVMTNSQDHNPPLVASSSVSPSKSNSSSAKSSPAKSPNTPKEKKPRKQKIVSNPSIWTEPPDLLIANCVNTFSNSSSPASGKCDTCGKTSPENAKNMVICDNCKLEFHFYCLNPPQKYSPRRRGYSWYCKNCDADEPLEDFVDLN